MPEAKCSDSDFIRMFEELGAAGTARRLQVGERTVFSRRGRIEGRIGRQLTPPDKTRATRHNVEHPHRIPIDVENGVVLVGSDAHIWPGPQSTAQRAFVKFCKEHKPKAVILNGDVMDCARISRHPPIGWETRPSVQEEIEAAQDWLHKIENACPRGTEKVWTLGNHDGRFETRIATVAPEYAKVAGVHLSDHFPHWRPAWAAWINESVVVKHRFKNGIHAVHNATMWAGKTMVTGHLHSLKVTPFSDYNETRWGVDCGTLADPYGPQFRDYSEDNPKNHRSGFVVLTFKQGRLLWPELVAVFDENHVEFRGDVIKV